MADRQKMKPIKLKEGWSAEGELPYNRIPAYKAAFDCYKECQLRFRGVPVDSRPEAREIKAKLLRAMVCIAHARLNIKVQESLQEAVDLALEVQIIIRVLVDINAITKKDFALITRFSESLLRQMVGWAASENKKGKNYDEQRKEEIK